MRCANAARLREASPPRGGLAPTGNRLRRGLLIGSTVLEFAVLAGVLVVVLPRGSHHPTAATPKTPNTGGLVPDVNLALLEHGPLHGKRVRLSQLRGRWVVLSFGASWCKPCRGAQLRAVRALARDLNPQAVTILVAAHDNAKAARRTLAAPDGAYALALVRTNKTLKRLGVAAVPTTLLITPDRRLSLMMQGPGLAPIRRALLPAPTTPAPNSTTTDQNTTTG